MAPKKHSVQKHIRLHFFPLNGIKVNLHEKSVSVFKVAILEQLKGLHSINVALSCDQRKLIMSSTPFPGELPGY